MVPNPGVHFVQSLVVQVALVSATVVQQQLDPFFTTTNNGEDSQVCAEMSKSRDFVRRLSEVGPAKELQTGEAHRETANLRI
jgi:hypothetical protein